MASFLSTRRESTSAELVTVKALVPWSTGSCVMTGYSRQIKPAFSAVNLTSSQVLLAHLDALSYKVLKRDMCMGQQ